MGCDTAATRSTRRLTAGPSQLPTLFRWQTPVDLDPQYSGSGSADPLWLAGDHGGQQHHRAGEDGCERWVLGEGDHAGDGRSVLDDDDRLRAAAAQLDAADGRDPYAGR